MLLCFDSLPLHNQVVVASDLASRTFPVSTVSPDSSAPLVNTHGDVFMIAQSKARHMVTQCGALPDTAGNHLRSFCYDMCC